MITVLSTSLFDNDTIMQIKLWQFNFSGDYMVFFCASGVHKVEQRF